MFDKKTKILIIGVVLIIGASVTAYFLKNRGPQFKAISAQEAGDIAINYINSTLLAGADFSASLLEIEETNGIYKIHRDSRRDTGSCSKFKYSRNKEFS